MIAFCRPLKSGWKPMPSSSRAETLPATVKVPSVGRVVPTISLSRVDLPAPF